MMIAPVTGRSKERAGLIRRAPRPKGIFAFRFALVALAVTLPGSALGWSSGTGLDSLELAYIDPGAGSFMIQALVAALAGVAVTLRMYWGKIKLMLGITSSDEDDEDSARDDD
jgi:hypothetical protein